MTATRRLAAILAADIAGYSRLMGTDEEAHFAKAQVLREQHQFEAAIPEYEAAVALSRASVANSSWKRR